MSSKRPGLPTDFTEPALLAGELKDLRYAVVQGGRFVGAADDISRDWRVTVDLQQGNVFSGYQIHNQNVTDKPPEDVARQLVDANSHRVFPAEYGASSWRQVREGPPLSAIMVVSVGVALAVLLVQFAALIKYVSTVVVTGLPGYARLRGPEVLGNRTRALLHEAIQADPGVSPPELHRRLGGGWTTIVYHLGVLEKAGLVSSLLDGRHKRFFPVGAVDHSARARLSVLRNAKTRLFHETITNSPGIRLGRLAREGGMRVPSALWHLNRLEQVGLAAAQRTGRRVSYYPGRGSSGDP
jgi:predicted transcriptional regulator